MYAQLTVLNRSVIFAKCHDSCKTCEKIVRHKVCFIFIYKLGNIFACTQTEQVQRDVRSMHVELLIYIKRPLLPPNCAFSKFTHINFQADVLSSFGIMTCEQTDSHRTHFGNFPLEGAKTFDKCRRDFSS